MLFKISQALPYSSFARVTTLQTLRRHFATAPASENDPFKFNEQETNRILGIINTKSGELLAGYDISKAKLNKLEAWKLKNGNFNNLDDILHLDGFSVKIVEKFCKSLLGEEPTKRPPRKAASFVTPVMSDTQADAINSTLSLNIGVSSIIWSRLEVNRNGPCELTDWRRYDINDKKLNLHDLIQRCLYVDHLIPKADCYIFENPQNAQSTSPGNAEQVNINVQRAQLTAILGFAMANRNTVADRSKSNVFYLKRFLAARLFQHLVGTERVSAEKTILSFMRTYYNIDDVSDTEEELNVGGEHLSGPGNVSFPSEMRLMYKQAEGYQREFLGQTLLLNLAFVRLVLLRDAKARAAVTRNSKSGEVQ